MEYYSLLVGMGASLGIWRVIQGVVPRLALRWGGSALLVLVGALIGSRIGYVLWQPTSFTGNIRSAFDLQGGGYIWPGAVIGGWLVVILLAWLRQLPFGLVADRLLPMLPPMAIMTWLGCWQAGCGYGIALPDVWWAPLTMDETGMLTQRLPLQWFAAISLFLIMFAAEPRLPTRRPGQQAALIWLIFVLHTLVFSWFRDDVRPDWLGLPLDIWLLFFFFVSALGFCVYAFWPGRKIDKYA